MLNIPLSGFSQSNATDPLVITAPPSPESTYTSSSDTLTVIDKETIEQSGARSAAEVLQFVEGIDLQRYGSMGQMVRLSIRGSTHEQILILVDGHRLNTSSGGGADLNAIPLSMIQRIEIIRGAAAVAYGGDALAGVINIITKQESSLDHAGFASVGYGMFHTGLAAVGYKGKLGKSKDMLFGVNGQFGFSQGEYTYYDQLRGTVFDRKNSGFLGYGVSSTLSIPLSQPTESISMQVLHSYRDAGVPGTHEYPTESANQKNSLALVGVNVAHILGSTNIKQDIAASYTYQWRHHLDTGTYMIDDFHKNHACVLNTGLSGLLGLNQWSIQLDGALDFLESSALESTGGNDASGMYQRYKIGLALSDAIHIAPYPIKHNTPVGRIVLIPGVRVDFHSFYDWQFAYQFGLLVHLDPKKRYILKSGCKNGYRLPSFSDLFWTESAFAQGNPDLKPEHSLSTDLGFHFHPIITLKGSISTFFMKYTNLIIWNPGAGGVWRPINLGHALGFGGEAMVSYYVDIPSIKGGFEWTGNYSLQFLLNQAEPNTATYNKWVPYRPIQKGMVRMNYLHYKKHFAWVACRYVGFRYTDPSNVHTLDAYFVLDAAIGFKRQNWTFSTTVYNILNHAYIDLKDFPVPGIEIMGNIQYAFE